MTEESCNASQEAKCMAMEAMPQGRSGARPSKEGAMTSRSGAAVLLWPPLPLAGCRPGRPLVFDYTLAPATIAWQQVHRTATVLVVMLSLGCNLSRTRLR